MQSLSMSIARPTADAFERWWHQPGEWVEPANQRRGGESGVLRLPPRDPAAPPLFCKRQTGHLYRSLLHPWGRPTIHREWQAYQALARLGVPTPALVFAGTRRVRGQWQAVLVTEALEGFVSLEQWSLASATVAPDLKCEVLRQVGRTLARLHRGGWQHGCCYPKHLFVRVDDAQGAVQVALLDLEKARRRWRGETAAARDLGQLWRHRGALTAGDMACLVEAHRDALFAPAAR